MSGAAIIDRARACVGAPFRPQGRDPTLGLDCVGLVLVALGPAIRGCTVARDYALSGTGLAARAVAGLAELGGKPVTTAAPGDVVLFEPARAQGHLAVKSEHGIIHAHLGLRRVVEGPADSAWPVQSVWRFEAGE